MKYEILYSDCPWPYDLIGKNFSKMITKTQNGFRPVISAEDHYPTMTIEELKAIPVQDISEKNALLFFWITGPLLDQAFSIIQAWGFKYKTVAFVWDKQKVNPGAYTMSQTEFCLVAKRGNIPKPRGARNIRQFLSECRTEHSRKPEEFRRRIEAMFPEQRKIELFARTNRPGWTVLGNGIDGADIVSALRKEAAK